MNDYLDSFKRNMSKPGPVPLRRVKGETDHLLGILVALANDRGQETAVTLSTPSGFISGIIVSGFKYFESAAAPLLLSEPNDRSDWLITQLVDMTNQYAARETPNTDVPYVHLKEARFFSAGNAAGTAMLTSGVWWRGRLSEVVGFSFGLMPHYQDPEKAEPIGFQAP